jgi:DinB family protein
MPRLAAKKPKPYLNIYNRYKQNIMFNLNLTQAVEEFARMMLPLTEKDLEHDWQWKDHDEEGIRFAFFVTLQELRQLAVTLSTLRSQRTAAQQILSQYHAAYLDLQAAVFGLSDEDAEKIPAEGEWQVRKAYGHILGTEFGFTSVVRYALELHRANKWTKDPIPDTEYPRLYAISEADYDQLREGPLSGMLAYHHNLHNRIVQEFSNITDQELDLPSTFWEETRFPIRHRLHRYEAHFTQHTIQIDKTLVATDQAPTESQRLIRKIYAALAEVEGQLIGAEKTDETAITATALSIQERTKEISDLLK